MKKLILLLLFIPLVSFGQNKSFNTYNSNKISTNVVSQQSINTFNKGNEYYNIADYDNAIIQYSKSIDIDKKNNLINTDAFINRANSMVQMNDFDNALKDLGIVINNESDIEYLTIAYSIRASIYGENGRFIEALSDIENSLKLNPNDVNTIYNKARLQIVQKKYKEGIITLEIVESIYKKQKLNIPVLISSIHYMKGICRYSLKEDNFCVDFNKALVFINFLDKNNIDFIKNVCE